MMFWSCASAGLNNRSQVPSHATSFPFSSRSRPVRICRWQGRLLPSSDPEQRGVSPGSPGGRASQRGRGSHAGLFRDRRVLRRPRAGRRRRPERVPWIVRWPGVTAAGSVCDVPGFLQRERNYLQRSEICSRPGFRRAGRLARGDRQGTRDRTVFFRFTRRGVPRVRRQYRRRGDRHAGRS
jgi:hypothetical protein